MNKRFAFYDFETTGTSPKFDQALQFAAVLTDDDFTPIEEVNIRCQLADHILPSPIAMAITGITPDGMHTPNMSSFEFSIELADLVKRWRPAIWTGYNTISFDENVFRQLFYQNLQPDLYLTQTNGNQRLDILKAVQACWAFDKQELKIPIRENGKHTAKLDRLAPLNGFEHHNAHDALGDVKATIHIAQIIRYQIPEIWNVIISNLDKNYLKRQLYSGVVLGLIERFGSGPPKIYRGVFCGTNRDNSNQIGFFDLSQADIHDYLSGDAALYAEAIKGSPKIIRTIDLNKIPLLFPIPNPSIEDSVAGQLVINSQAALAATSEVLAERYSDNEPSNLVENQIYQGFYSHQDKALIRRFHSANWSERWGIVSEFSDARLKELGSRLMVMYAPQFTPEKVKNDFNNLIAGRWSGDVFYGESTKRQGNTYESIQADLERLKAGEFGDIDADFLKQLIDYFSKRIK